MPFSLCDHLSANIATCTSGLPTGTPCACICKSADGESVRPRIRNLHAPEHGKLVKATGTPPAGFAAVYDFQHDTTGTQSPGTVIDGDWTPYAGGTVKIRVRYQGPGGPTQFDLETDQPLNC